MDEINKKYLHKIGIILCLENQTTEEEMYGNNVCTDSFYKFLKSIAFEVELNGFTNYSGGLDTQNDHTGTKSFYINFYGHEIMFHVVCFLPYEENSKRIAYSAYNDVPCFYQPLKQRYDSLDDNFRKMFLTLILNAEFASKQCLKMKSASCKGNEVILSSFCTDQCGSQIILPKSEKAGSASNTYAAVIRGKLPGGCTMSLLSYRYWLNAYKSTLNILCELAVSQRFIVFISSNNHDPCMEPTDPQKVLLHSFISRITIYMSGKYSVSFLLAGPDLLESKSLIKLLTSVTRGNSSTTVIITQENFQTLNIKTNDMGKIIKIDDDDNGRMSYGMSKDCYILEVNKRLMGPYGRKICKKILNMRDPYHITFCLPLKPIFNEYSIFPEPQISCEIE
ncbi:hypothetical protein MXB_3830 [Myxobolus squamalis]|nr:hypothetical protein MXB_3830 [Myxobolus squamalis]